MKTAIRLGPIAHLRRAKFEVGCIRKPGMWTRDKPSITYLATIYNPEWGEAGAWNFLIKLSNLMQNIFMDFEHPTFRGWLARKR